VVIYTDGSCCPNPGNGGWAAILRFNDIEKELAGGVQNTTNNRMELRAAVEALSVLKRPCDVDLYSDSTYLSKGVTQWMPAWQKQGWKKRNGELANVDLWKKLYALTEGHKITWHWVKGHSGDNLNERVDKLAREASREVAMLSVTSNANDVDDAVLGHDRDARMSLISIALSLLEPGGKWTLENSSSGLTVSLDQAEDGKPVFVVKQKKKITTFFSFGDLMTHLTSQGVLDLKSLQHGLWADLNAHHFSQSLLSGMRLEEFVSRLYSGGPESIVT
jgi:ribonuclease HI